MLLSRNYTDNGSDTYEGFSVTNKSLKRQYILVEKRNCALLKKTIKDQYQNKIY
jgi:hypothetical protein